LEISEAHRKLQQARLIMIKLPTNIPDLPPFLERVRRAVSSESLKAAAASTEEPLLLLGFAFLARAGHPVRGEIARKAVAAAPNYAPIAALLAVTLDRIDESSLAELIRTDPTNALGHYLQGALLHASKNDADALHAFRIAARLPEARFYSDILGKASFVALNALNLDGADRLCAMSWSISRWLGFSSIGLQPIIWSLPELARNLDPTLRTEVADVLLNLAGHLFATHFTNRWFAQRAVEQAFIMRADLEHTYSAKRHGYATVIYALSSPLLSVPGLKEWWSPGPFQLAQFLPDRINRAFADSDPESPGVGGESIMALNEPERAGFKAARENAVLAARRLIDVALPEGESILGSYLETVAKPESTAGPMAAFQWTAVENLLQKRPDLFQAAAAAEEAMATVWKAGETAPSRRNAARILELA
jgi:hypothetical protein